MLPESHSTWDRRSPDRDAAAAAAAHLIARRDAGLSAEEQAEFRAWIKADPRHAAALAAMDARPSALDWPLYTGTADRVVTGLEARAQRRRTRRRMLVRVSGIALALLLGIGLFARLHLYPDDATGSLVVQTPQQQILPDGSVVELKDGAEMKVAFTPAERRVELVRGTAHFKVRKDPTRPFLVFTGAITARAVGTAFLVGLETNQVALLVTEGKVAVDHTATQPASAAPADLPARPETLALVQAGESIAVTPAASRSAAPVITPLPATEWSDRLAWRTPRLEFSSTPLREVVEIVNRYNREPLVIADESLAKLKLSGALRADRVDALLEILEADLHVTAIRADGQIRLQRSP